MKIGTLALGVMLCTAAVADPPEVSSADGPTPMATVERELPHYKLAPRDHVTEREAIYAYVRGTHWITLNARGQIVFHDCADPDRIASQLADAPPGIDRLVRQMADVMSYKFSFAIEPVKRQFLSELHGTDLDAEFRRLAHRMIRLDAEAKGLLLHASERAGIAVELEADAEPDTEVLMTRKECTTGRCDCGYCAPDRVCDCRKWSVTMLDCPSMIRASCNTDEPKEPSAIFPELTYGY